MIYPTPPLRVFYWLRVSLLKPTIILLSSIYSLYVISIKQGLLGEKLRELLLKIKKGEIPLGEIHSYLLSRGKFRCRTSILSRKAVSGHYGGKIKGFQGV
jgi:hypothetical protein